MKIKIVVGLVVIIVVGIVYLTNAPHRADRIEKHVEEVVR